MSTLRADHINDYKTTLYFNIYVKYEYKLVEPFEVFGNSPCTYTFSGNLKLLIKILYAYS